MSDADGSEEDRLRNELREREKELDCLYSLAGLFLRRDAEAKNLVEGLAFHLRQAMSVPEKLSLEVCVRGLKASLGPSGEGLSASAGAVQVAGEGERSWVVFSYSDPEIPVSPREREMARSALLLAGLALKAREASDFPEPALSFREREVVRLIRRGSSSKEIAAALGLSPATVERHRYNIRKKLGMTGKKEGLSSYLV